MTCPKIFKRFLKKVLKHLPMNDAGYTFLKNMSFRNNILKDIFAREKYFSTGLTFIMY